MWPNQELAQLRFRYEKTKDKALWEKMMVSVKKEKMVPFYEQLCEQFHQQPDKALLASMKKQNEEDVKKLEEKLKDAEENLGDIEVKNCLLEIADYFNKIGDKETAEEKYKPAFEKTVGAGGKMDVCLTNIRIGLFYEDLEMVKKYIDAGKKELEKGCDWERKNKLKVYEGIYMMTTRDFKKAAAQFLESVATFTATELVEFEEFVFYAVVMSMIGLDRADIRTKVIGSPEILSVVHEKPHVKEFMYAYFHCDYKQYMREFVHVIDHMRNDRFFHNHLTKIIKELRLIAYKQFITSYKSVTIKSMAETFGVSPKFIEEEIYLFVSQAKLQCKIDSVAGVIETLDSGTGIKSGLYKEMVKDGDNLLNKMQKLAAAIDR